MGLHEYIEQAVSQIRAKKARDMVAQELRAHIEDQAAFYEAEGKEADEAVAEAVRQMGDPVEVGITLDKIHKPQTDWRMIGILALVCLLGFLLQTAITGAVSKIAAAPGSVPAGGVFSSFSRSAALSLIISVIVLVAVCLADYTAIIKKTPVIMAGILALLWALAFFLPSYHGGYLYMRNCLYLFVPLYGCALYLLRGRGVRGFVYGILLSFGIVLLTMEIVGIGVELRFLLVVAVMLTTAVCNGWFGEKKKGLLAVLWCGGLAGLCALAGLSVRRGGFRGMRLVAILHPEKYADTYGYYAATMRQWAAQSRLWGNPEAAQELAGNYIAINGSEGVFFLECGDSNIIYLLLRYGIVPFCLVVGAFLFCIGFFLYKCLRQKNQLGTVIGLGCCITFFVEFLGYAASNLGYFPNNATAPFLSYDGISSVVWAVLLGYVFSIVRYQNLVPASGVTPGKRYKYRLRLEKVEMDL